MEGIQKNALERMAVMDGYEEYNNIIKQCLNNDANNIQLVSETSNLVFKADTKKHGKVYIKFYLNRSSHIDNEMKLYDIVDNTYLKEIITASDNPKYTVFKEVKGKTIDELNAKQIERYKEKIINSVINFYESTSKFKTKGYGLLDENLNGSANNFQDFIVQRQADTQKELIDYPLLNNLFSKIYKKYKNLIIEDNALIPIDTNMKNIMITEDDKIKFIDPGELIGAPILMGYGDFVAHTYKTQLYECLIEKLNLNEEDEKRLRIYAICSSLNILAFLKRLGVSELDKVIPYGNTYTFYDLIKEHMEKLGI